MKPRSCFISIIVLSLIFSSFSFSTGTEQEPTAFAFKGEGDKVTENFLLDPGAAIFNFCHEGNANFLVKLFDWEGDLVGLLVDEIGHFEGEVLVRIRSQNKFVLKITADGDWTVKGIRPSISKGLKPPLNFSGHGYEVTKPIELSVGLITFSMSHDGKSNFIVKLTDEKGSLQELLVNEIGEYRGKKSAA